MSSSQTANHRKSHKKWAAGKFPAAHCVPCCLFAENLFRNFHNMGSAETIDLKHFSRRTGMTKLVVYADLRDRSRVFFAEDAANGIARVRR